MKVCKAESAHKGNNILLFCGLFLIVYILHSNCDDNDGARGGWFFALSWRALERSNVNNIKYLRVIQWSGNSKHVCIYSGKMSVNKMREILEKYDECLLLGFQMILSGKFKDSIKVKRLYCG